QNIETFANSQKGSGKTADQVTESSKKADRDESERAEAEPTIDDLNEILESVDDDMDFPFSVNEKNQKAKGVSAKELQKKFPDAKVVQSESELPEPVQAKIRRQKVSGLVKGLFYNGNVYLVADNAENMSGAVKTYRHEMLGHKGVTEHLGERL